MRGMRLCAGHRPPPNGWLAMAAEVAREFLTADQILTLIAELLVRARAGDATALEKLLEIHRDSLREIAVQQLAPKLKGRLDGSDMLPHNVPWRDLPERFGESNSVVQRFHRWAKTRGEQWVFDALSEPDLE